MTDMLFARNPGPGTRMYRSPSPDVDDIALVPMKWISVPVEYKRVAAFVRDQKLELFEVVETDDPPIDVDLEIPQDLLAQLDSNQVSLVKEVCLPERDKLLPEHQDAIEVAKHISDSGIPGKNRERVTVSYLREHHRPFLMAILNLEQRHQKRRPVISLVKKQLERISNLPG